MGLFDHTDVKGYEYDGSTRASTHPHTKYQPFREATSTSLSTLFTVARGETATNLVTNPRVESSTISMFTASGSAISRDTGQQSVGAASLLVNPANSAAGEGMYWESPTIPFSTQAQFLTVAVEHRGASASGNVKIDIRDNAGTTIHATSGSDNLATSFRRITAQYTIPPLTASTTYRLYVVSNTQHNINWYLDKFQFELRHDTTAVSDYTDGSFGINHFWTGTANASESYKRHAMSIIRGITIKNESSTAADIVYVGFDNDAADEDSGIPIIGATTFQTNFPIHFTKKITLIAAQNTPTVSGVIWGVSSF